MNDLRALEDLGSALDPPTGPPERLRQRALAAHGPRVRGWQLGLAGGIAASVAAGVVLAAQLVVVSPPQALNAAEILRAAAAYAQTQPAAVRGDQFIYVESSVAAIEMSATGGGGGKGVPKQRRAWLSVDGTRDGMIRERPAGGSWTDIPLPGCRNGVSQAEKGGKVYQVPCKPTPGYQSDLPTDANRMRAYLYGRAGATKNPVDQQVFKEAVALIREARLSPATLAAVYQALATIPGVSVLEKATDPAGRTGIAVTATSVQGARTELIFDRKTYAFLGERMVLVRDQDGLRAGQVLDSAAVLTVAIVNRAGQLPS